MELQLESARLLLELARGTGAEWGGWIQQICQFEAEVLHVERVSFWSFDEAGSSMTCDAGYVVSTREFEHGATLFAADLPEFFEAIRQSRALNVAKVHADDRVRSLGDYCAARGVVSMLDIPVWAEGRLSGVLCHEHVGQSRRWSTAEEDFAVGVGQVIASALAARAHTLGRAAANRAAFLDAVSRAVVSSLDAREIARRAVDVALPKLADIAFVWMLNRDGVLECLAWTHVDPRKQPIVDEVIRDLARTAESPSLATRVLRQRQSLLLPDFSPAVLELHHLGPAQRAAFYRLGVTASIGVPLAVGGRTLGVMDFFAAGRHYSIDDRALAEEVADRVAAALENARIHAIASEAIRARDDFLVVVAHELRTPLTSLQLMSDDLVRKAERRAEADEAKRTDAIARQVRRLGGLVEDVIDALSIRAEGVKLALASCELVSIVQSCAEKVAKRAQRAGSPIAVRADRSIVGRFDRARVEQVVLALLDNAVKFGNGKPIEVSLRRHDAEAELTVRDHGQGIAPERLSSIFAPFERAASKEHFGGLGLGLFRAKAIVAAHGGSIAAESTLGEGTTCVVRLPLSSEVAESHADPTSPSARLPATPRASSSGASSRRSLVTATAISPPSPARGVFQQLE